MSEEAAIHPVWLPRTVPVRRLPAWVMPGALLALEAGAILGIGRLLGVEPAMTAPAAAACHLLLSLLLGDVTPAQGAARPPIPAAVFGCALLAAATGPEGRFLLEALPAILAWAVLGLVAIVGNGSGAAGVLDMLRRAGDEAVDVVGYFDDRTGRPGPLTGRLPHLGNVDRPIAFVEDQEISDVYLALPWTAGARITELVDRLRFLPMMVRLVPDDPLPEAVEATEAARMVLPVLLRPPVPPAGFRAKAAFDAVAALVIVALLSPVFLLVPLLIKLDSPGPVFFRQMRIGRFGRRFSILKFRTLHAAQSDAEAERLVTRGDRRVTRVGRLLRKHSVDELPQLLNVLRGEMSLVGPRPHAQKSKADGRLYADIVPDHLRRYRVRPGLTGWAQVNGFRGGTDTEETLRARAAYDFAHIRGWSFLFDLWILMRTVPATLLPPSRNR